MTNIVPGEKFEKLTALECVQINGRSVWRCICDCGNEIIVRSDLLKNGKKTSCGCDGKYNLIGKRFGKLVVVEKAGKNNRGKTLWKCECDCGGMKTTFTSALISGEVKSCGCLIGGKYDLAGKSFGRLTVLKEAGKTVEQNVLWECQCECGNIVKVKASHLIAGTVKSCGCLKNSHQDLTGKRFGRLTVIGQTEERKNGSPVWECRCDCGNTTYVVSRSLTNGHTLSCGCLQRKVTQEKMKAYQESIKGVTLVDGTNVNVCIGKRLNKNNTSGYKGVNWDKRSQKWRAYITFQGTCYFLGLYENKQDAAKARKMAEERLYGDFLEYYKEAYPESWPMVEAKIRKKQAKAEAEK